MNMTSDIRVRTDRHHKGLYNDFRNFVVKDMHEMFFLCACLGYLKGKRKPLGKDGEDRFWSSTITPDEYANYYAMVLDINNMDFSTISDDKQVVAIMEEYANAGMGILMEEVLSEYTIERGGDLHLEKGYSAELPKIVLAYVYAKAIE